MDYFKILNLILGTWMAVGGGAAVVFFDDLKRLLPKVYPETRPRWLPVAGAGFLALVMGTWAAVMKNFTMENFAVTLVLSLGLVKIAPFVFCYRKARELLWALVAEPLAFRMVSFSAAAVGAALLVMGIFF